MCTAAEPADEGAGDVPRTVAGEVAGEDGGPAFAEAAVGELETAAP